MRDRDRSMDLRSVLQELISQTRPCLPGTSELCPCTTEAVMSAQRGTLLVTPSSSSSSFHLGEHWPASTRIVESRRVRNSPVLTTTRTTARRRQPDDAVGATDFRIPRIPARDAGNKLKSCPYFTVPNHIRGHREKFSFRYSDYRIPDCVNFVYSLL